ncbi:MAG: HD domain-containing protein [Eubacterium sp.]|nr:HD domain-containing protein [Eubacterium sp.]
MYYLKDYREGQKLTGTYLCKSKQILKTKAGKTYYSLILQDKTGTADAKIWELNNGIASFEAMDYIYCEGMVTSFQGNIQMNISRLRKSEEGEYDPADYIPTTQKDVGEMFEQVLSYIRSVKNPYLSQLLKKFFLEDKAFVEKFKKHSAAKSVHHGFMGGLLEHTLSVTNMCEYFAGAYPNIQRDLLITASLFHDMGKIDEIAAFPRNDYTDAGQLLGHIYIGAQKLSAVIAEISGFPKKLENELLHCILSHHGKLEFGSPKVPALLEAMALHLADNADAKLQTLTEIFGQADDNMDWLGYNRMFESNLRQTSEGGL